MKNKLIYKLFTLSFLFALLVSVVNPMNTNAATHELEELNIQVELNQDGSALIKEHRIATLSEGTENYIIIGNLGESTIKDFTVTENGTTYEYVDNWNIDATREDKINKNGIIKEKDHYELAWGIGEYGKHEYHLQYTVTDFIKQLDDSQMLFWQFVNDETNIPPKRVTVEIEADKPLTEDEERIWAFGFEGDIHFEDDKIIAKNDSPLTSSNYVTILTEFPDNEFATNDVINSSFEEIKEKAMSGSDYTDDNFSIFFKIIGFLLLFLLLPVVIIGVIIFFIKADKTKYKDYEGEYYREVPYEGSFQDTYGLISKIKLSQFDYLLASFILKWIHEDRIRFELEESQGFFRTKEIGTIYLVDHDTSNLQTEEAKLFEFFKSASKDDVLTEDDFKKWSTKHYKRISKWENKLKKDSLQKMNEAGYLDKKTEYILKLIPIEKEELTEIGREFEGNVYMFMNYLKDYSLLNEHEPVNVKLWDEYMIWAALLGITDVVYEQFKVIYPQYEQESSFTPIMLSNVTSYSSTVNSAISSAASGGGGSSSIGGGGGSFGGGSGGGTR